MEHRRQELLGLARVETHCLHHEFGSKLDASLCKVMSVGDIMRHET